MPRMNDRAARQSARRYCFMSSRTCGALSKATSRGLPEQDEQKHHPSAQLLNIGPTPGRLSGEVHPRSINVYGGYLTSSRDMFTYSQVGRWVNPAALLAIYYLKSRATCRRGAQSRAAPAPSANVQLRRQAGLIRNFGFDELGQERERLLPSEIAGLRGNDVRHTFLQDVQFSPDRDLL